MAFTLAIASAAMVQRGANHGRPEDLPARAGELGQAAASSFDELWRTRVGLEPGELKLNTVEQSSLGKLLVDREREKMKTELRRLTKPGGIFIKIIRENLF